MHERGAGAALSDTRVETQVQVPAWSQHTLEITVTTEVESGESGLYTLRHSTLSVAETHVIVTAVKPYSASGSQAAALAFVHLPVEHLGGLQVLPYHLLPLPVRAFRTALAPSAVAAAG